MDRFRRIHFMSLVGIVCLTSFMFGGSPMATISVLDARAEVTAEMAVSSSCAGAGYASDAASTKIGFWQQSQRRGANFFDLAPHPEKFASARSFGIDFVRLAFDKWDGGESHFLMGDLWYYGGLVEDDLALLRQTLDAAAAAEMPVVLTALRLPGLPYRNADGFLKGLLWTSEDYRDQAIRYWRDLAAAMRDHPAIVGYNLINEPNPDDPDLVHPFYLRLIDAIRSVDPDTPIMLDAANVASPAALEQMPPIDDPGALYAFHLFEPVPFTFPREGRTPTYPGWITDQAWEGYWDVERLAGVLEPVRRWRSEQAIPAWRIVASEFGGDRFAPGLEVWLADVIDLLNSECWHWAFYAYREDGWDRMDYELGARELGLPPPDDPGRASVLANARTSESPAFRVLRRALFDR